MKAFFFIFLLLLFSGCASNGYNPHYIVSEGAEEAIIEYNDSL